MYSTDRQELAGLGQIGSAFDPTRPMSLSSMYQFVKVAVGWVALPLEALTRHSFGIRYLSTVRIALAYGPLFFLWFALGAGGADPFFTLFLVASFGACLWHRFRAGQRLRRQIPWLSTSFGVSHLEERTRLSDWTAYKWVEPAICAVATLLVAMIDNAAGAYLLLATLCLFIHRQLVWNEYFDWSLTKGDVEIYNRYMAEAAQGMHKQHTAGLHRPAVVAMPPASAPVSPMPTRPTSPTATGSRSILDDVLGPNLAAD